MIARAFGAIVALTGFIPAIVAVLDASEPIRRIALWSLGGSVLVLVGVLVAPEALRAYRARRSLPTEAELEDHCSGYQLEQATRRDIAWIAELEASVYSRADAIPERILEEWYAANPRGFSVIKGPNGRLIGHLDILPLRPSTLKAFCKGDIVEKDIRGDSLFTETERHVTTVLYVESIILRPEKPLTPASAMKCVLKNLPSLIQRVADPAILDKVYAIAATEPGEKLMRRLGFELECTGERRTDHHNLFVAQFSELSRQAARLSGEQTGLTGGL